MDNMSPLRSVGFIGLGDEDAPMARAVAESPFTGDPETAVRCAELTELRGISLLDAPVSGVARELCSESGGRSSAAVLLRSSAQPVFDTFSASAIYTGGPGSAQVAKLLNNAVTMTVKDIEHFAEGVGRLGIDTSEVRDRGRAWAEERIVVAEVVERHLR